MNKEQILAIIQGGHTTDGDLADALLAELAKVQEPVGYLNNRDSFCHVDSPWVKANPEHCTPLYLQPLPQPDLVAEIERLKEQYVSLQLAQASKVEELRKQLSAAQASEDELLNALETLACLGNGNCYGNSHGNVIAQQAIATHKARKEGK